MRDLFIALDAFLQEPRRCGHLEGGVEVERVWMTCDCGAVTRTGSRPRVQTCRPPLMLRALVARLRMWLDALIECGGPRRWQTRTCAACRRQIPKRALKRPYCGAWLAWGER